MVVECPRCGNQLWQVILDDPARKLDQCPKCGNTLSTSTPREAEWISELEGTQSAAEQDQTSGQEEKRLFNQGARGSASQDAAQPWIYPGSRLSGDEVDQHFNRS